MPAFFQSPADAFAICWNNSCPWAPKEGSLQLITKKRKSPPQKVRSREILPPPAKSASRWPPGSLRNRRNAELGDSEWCGWWQPGCRVLPCCLRIVSKTGHGVWVAAAAAAGGPAAVRLCGCACVRACLHACMPACLRACSLRTCVHACLRACVPACLPACLPACRRACVPACLRACVPGVHGVPALLRACAPARLRACVPACLRACLPACLRACVRGCVPARVRACLRACVPACVPACGPSACSPLGFCRPAAMRA